MLKAKTGTGFKPKAKARPRTNVQPSSAPSSSAQPSVERQTETPVSQTTSLPTASTESTGAHLAHTVEVEVAPRALEPVTSQPSTTREEVRPASQSTTTTTQESRSAPTTIISEQSATSTSQSSVTVTPLDPTISAETRPTLNNVPATPSSSERLAVAAAAPLSTAISPSAVNGTSTASSSQPTARVAATKGKATAQSQKRSRPLPTAPSGVSGTPSEVVPQSEEADPGPSRPAKRRKVARPSQDDVRPSIEDEESQSEAPAPKRRRKPRDPNAPKRKRKKESTPEDAETQVIDISTTKMSELTKDLHIGRNHSMRETILQREIDRKEKLRLARELNNPDSDDEEAEGVQNGQNQDNPDNAEAEPPAVPDAAAGPSVNANAPVVAKRTWLGPSLRRINGDIVLDESSLQVNRQEIAAEEVGEMQIEKVDDFSRLVTSATHQKREKNTRWGHNETEKFYEGLKRFGINFEMISRSFGGKRTRRQVKLKFNREEVDNPGRVTKCLSGDRPQETELGKVKNTSDYKDWREIEAEIEAMKDSDRQEAARAAEEKAEEDRQARAKIMAGSGASGGAGGTGRAGGAESSRGNEISGHSAGAASKSKKKPTAKQSKRAKIQHMGAEDVIIVGDRDTYEL